MKFVTYSEGAAKDLKFVTYSEGAAAKERQDTCGIIGLLHPKEDTLIPISSLGLGYATMNELIDSITGQDREKLREAEKRKEFPVRLQDVRLLAPIPNPKQDVICLGVNYKEHAREAAEFKKEAFDIKAEYPVYFSKRVSRASGHQEGIPSYEGLVDSLDYEVELAVIIGRDARNVPEGKSREYLFGYTILNDMSARNLQTRHNQWYFGKSLDGFTPMGPCIVTADAVSYPPQLSIQSYVNDELRQSSNTQRLIFDIDRVIHELSRGMTLKAGTIISMGTPEGVGMGYVPPRFLKPGDVVRCEVEGIGCLENRILKEGEA